MGEKTLSEAEHAERKKEFFLFIGGPKDGEKYYVMTDSEYTGDEFSPVNSNLEKDKGLYETTGYTPVNFNHFENIFVCFIYVDIYPDDAMKMLFESYKPKNSIE